MYQSSEHEDFFALWGCPFSGSGCLDGAETTDQPNDYTAYQANKTKYRLTQDQHIDLTFELFDTFRSVHEEIQRIALQPKHNQALLDLRMKHSQSFFTSKHQHIS